MKPLEVEEDAERELGESAIYYERQRPRLGLEFEAAIREALNTIREAPERSPLRKDGTRRHLMRRFPFIIHYVIMPDHIWIVAFAHASRKPGYWQSRIREDHT